MSEQSKLCTEENELPLSVHTVVSHDDLLIEILRRIPSISLHIFKYVSKHWQSLIKSPVLFPHWRKNQKIDPSSGFFLKSSSGYDFVSLDSRINRFSLHSMLREAGSDFFIMQSCNGLLLCCIKPNKYYVYNPTTNLFKMLPECEDLPFEWLSSYSGMRLAFDPTKSPHYKNDAIHGIEVVCSVFHRKFSTIEEYQKADVMLAPLLHDKEVGDNRKLLESRGCLYFVGTVTQHLPIYEIRNGDSEWSLKYVIDLDDVMKLLHENQMRLSKLYNIVLKSLCEVGDLKSISPPDMDPTKLDMFHFIASSTSV
ncbi:F-box protein-like protein [Tanacetum coccineum]